MKKKQRNNNKKNNTKQNLDLPSMLEELEPHHRHHVVTIVDALLKKVQENLPVAMQNRSFYAENLAQTVCSDLNKKKMRQNTKESILTKLI